VVRENNLPFRFIHSFWLFLWRLFKSTIVPRSAPNTAQILCRSFTPKSHRQLRVKDLPNDPTWRLQRYSNPRPFGRKASNLPMSHHAPHIINTNINISQGVICRGLGVCPTLLHCSTLCWYIINSSSMHVFTYLTPTLFGINHILILVEIIITIPITITITIMDGWIIA